MKSSKSASIRSIFSQKSSLISDNKIEIWIDTIPLYLSIIFEAIFLLSLFDVIMQINKNNGMVNYFLNIYSNPGLFIVFITCGTINLIYFSIRFKGKIPLKFAKIIIPKEEKLQKDFLVQIGEEKFHSSNYRISNTNNNNQEYKVPGLSKRYSINKKIRLIIQNEDIKEFELKLSKPVLAFQNELTIRLKKPFFHD